MREHELGDLLRASVEQVREPDLAQVTWAQGRRRRRRRSVAGGVVGGGATLGALALLVVGPWSGGPVGPPGEPLRSAAAEAGLPVRPPVPLDPGSAASEQGRQVWVSLYSACLDDRGYAVSSREDGLVASRSDVVAGERDRDLARCRAELALDAPARVVPLPGPETERMGPEAGAGVRAESERWGVDAAGTRALTERYRTYGRVNRCLTEAGLPAGPVPAADSFVQDYAWAQVPPWHPYLEAAEQDRYAEARDACPVPQASPSAAPTP